MRPYCFLLAGIFAVCMSTSSFAQYEFLVPDYKLETKEDYAKYEQDIVRAANWLEATPIGKDDAKRKSVNGFVIAWVSGSPSVSVQLYSTVGKITDKNPELLAMFIAGYARYALENNYDKDEVKSYVAAIKSMINLYNLGGAVKKNKTLQKVIEAEKSGNLENWVKENYKSK